MQGGRRRERKKGSQKFEEANVFFEWEDKRTSSGLSHLKGRLRDSRPEAKIRFDTYHHTSNEASLPFV